MEPFLQNLHLSGFPDNVPFDAIITLLVFLVGIPALVLQFMAPDVRRVTMDRVTFPKEVFQRLVIAIILVFVSLFFAWTLPEYRDLVFALMLIFLFVIVATTTIQVQYRYGWREAVISTLKRKVLSSLENNGRLDGDALKQLIEIGKQSEAGPDREVVLEATGEIVAITCSYKTYNGDSLGFLVDGVVKMLASRPAPEDIPNYQLAVSILITILSAPNADTLIDQQHAVRALSALGQTLVTEIVVSVGTDHIIMDYVEALGLAVARHQSMLTDVTQSLLEVGSVALEHGHYLLAVASLERTLSIIEDHAQKPDEALADLLGLTAHFWTSGVSGKEFSQSRFQRIEACLRDTFPRALEKAKLHSQMTMRFDTADKLAEMTEGSKPKNIPRKKK